MPPRIGNRLAARGLRGAAGEGRIRFIMNTLARLLLTSATFLALATPVLGHHSAAAFDTRTQVKVTGNIIRYRFANPHVYLTLQVNKPDGSTVDTEIEAGAASVLNGLGFNKDSVKVGEVVTVLGNPDRKNPDAFVLGMELHKSDGTYVPLNISSRSIYTPKDEKATSIAGTWFSPRTEFFGYMGTAGKWEVTDRAKAARAKSDPRATVQKDCVPIGAPALMFYPVATTITVAKDRVTMKVDWMDSERVVHLDGRAHPPASQTSLHGHSVGRWEGNTLVVETTNFSEHPMGLSTGLPSSAQKKLTERFRVSDDGKFLLYSGVVEDPVYLAKPSEWSGKWEYRPNMPHSGQKCDLEVARKFLEQ
jgi:hypothetical protein